eukprot:CAMPEP_0170201994 /NCGR_PEP_ID=MMETSP0116_2-20130129/465_1 /TAXON_ID=400756 /ORGANISM="Durinskia baltica, Strain CSIRO CS-38" /LENGTH=263 /DNA_ID=CAMNT_0010452233 /DNA_START=9 /DNA_END=800 /DNA_ORIENTATION=+
MATTGIMAGLFDPSKLSRVSLGVGILAFVAFVCVAKALRRRPLPGRLKPRGSFVHEDPANRDAREERRRDFARIVNTRRDIWVLTPCARSPAVLPIELGGDGSVNQDLGNLAHSQLKFWLQGELGRIPGAVDLNSTSQWAVVDRLVNFISVAPVFDFLMQQRVQPMTMQAKYLLMVSKSGQVRAAWYAFATDKVTPGATYGPFVLKLVSEDLNGGGRADRSYSDFKYTAKQTSERDMERLIAKHIPLILKGIDMDAWDAYLKA